MSRSCCPTAGYFQVAADFAALYASSLKRRYHSMRLVHTPPKPEQEGPRSGNRVWLTEDGDVVIDAEGDTVFITESFDDVTSEKLRKAVSSALRSASFNVR